MNLKSRSAPGCRCFAEARAAADQSREPHRLTSGKRGGVVLRRSQARASVSDAPGTPGMKLETLLFHAVSLNHPSRVGVAHESCRRTPSEGSRPAERPGALSSRSASDRRRFTSVNTDPSGSSTSSDSFARHLEMNEMSPAVEPAFPSRLSRGACSWSANIRSRLSDCQMIAFS